MTETPTAHRSELAPYLPRLVRVWSTEADASMGSGSNARFNVRVNQSLPFLRFSNADWEALVDVRNMFRDVDVDSSMYDEVFAIRAPKRIVGGLQVSF